MEFLKKNYEKILLGLVLLGLAVALAFLPFIIKSERATLDEKNQRVTGKPKPLPALDISREEAVLQRAETLLMLDFTTRHRLFNPVRWQKQPDGQLIKIQTGNETGVGALEVTAINPLYLVITYRGPSANGYLIGVERQAAKRPSDRSATEAFLTKDGKNKLLTFVGFKGPADKPTELDLTLNESGESVVIGPDKPFSKVEGYSADLKYPPDSKTWPARRDDDILPFAGDRYKIIAITKSSVVVSADSNKKRTTIVFNPPSEQR